MGEGRRPRDATAAAKLLESEVALLRKVAGPLADNLVDALPGLLGNSVRSLRLHTWENAALTVAVVLARNLPAALKEASENLGSHLEELRAAVKDVPALSTALPVVQAVHDVMAVTGKGQLPAIQEWNAGVGRASEGPRQGAPRQDREFRTGAELVATLLREHSLVPATGREGSPELSAALWSRAVRTAAMYAAGNDDRRTLLRLQAGLAKTTAMGITSPDTRRAARIAQVGLMERPLDQVAAVRLSYGAWRVEMDRRPVIARPPAAQSAPEPVTRAGRLAPAPTHPAQGAKVH